MSTRPLMPKSLNTRGLSINVLSLAVAPALMAMLLPAAGHAVAERGLPLSDGLILDHLFAMSLHYPLSPLRRQHPIEPAASAGQHQ
jgi:hypothetical protein